MKVIFNASTNTTFNVGMPNKQNNKDESEETKDSTKPNKALNYNELQLNSSLNESVGVLGGLEDSVSYESLSDEFKLSTNHKLVRLQGNKKVINLSIQEVFDQRLFSMKLRDLLVDNCVVYVKVVYSPNLVRMVGRQIIFSTYSIDGLIDL